MPIIESYYGPNFSLYLTDNIGSTEADKKNPDYRGNEAWILQGVNVLGEAPDQDLNGNGKSGEKSVLYAERGIRIGGSPHRDVSVWKSGEANSGCTFENINSALDAFAAYNGNKSDGQHKGFIALDYFTRYESVYYNTDLILKTPDGISTPRKSRICRPSDWREAVDGSDTDSDRVAVMWRKLIQYYEAYTNFIGGNIYVGAGQTLTIEGAGTIWKNPTGTLSSTGWVNTGTPNMNIDAKMIVVDPGGKLILEGSESTNINCNIYVNGGELEIMDTGQGAADESVENAHVFAAQY
jgi:hypothetical protein